MPRVSKITEPWADFCDRVEAIELGIKTDELYRELMSSPNRALAQYIIYLRSELCVHRALMAKLEKELRAKEAKLGNAPH
jgi:hypothetical protein